MWWWCGQRWSLRMRCTHAGPKRALAGCALRTGFCGCAHGTCERHTVHTRALPRVFSSPPTATATTTTYAAAGSHVLAHPASISQADVGVAAAAVGCDAAASCAARGHGTLRAQRGSVPVCECEASLLAKADA